MNEVDFRAECKAQHQKYPDIPTLRTIAFVGAYDAKIGSSEVDSSRLTTLLTYLLKSGIPIDPDFEIDVVNFREGRDFLLEDKKTDLLVVSYILEGRSHFLNVFHPHNTKPNDKLSLTTMVSKRNYPDFWRSRIEKADTKIVVTYGGKFEIGTEQFYPDDDFLVTLIPTPQDECMGRHAPPSLFKKLYPECPDLDIPYGWFGIIGEIQYLQSIRSSFNRSTYLGRKSLEVTIPPKTDEAHVVLPKIQLSP